MNLSFKITKSDIKKMASSVLEQVFSKQNMQDFMEKLRADIVKRTRMGYGVNQDLGTKEKLASLSKKYKKFRKDNPYNELSKMTNATRSNLTYSGQMLDSLYAKGDSTYLGSILVKDARKRVMGAKKAPKNSDLIKWHEDGAGRLPKRPFFHVSDLENARLEQAMQKKLVAALRKYKF